MIFGIEPFLRNKVLRADDLNWLAEQAANAGKLTSGGIAYSTASQNPSVYVAREPKRIRGFWAKIFITSGDYTDERYKVYRQRATGGATTKDQITREDDTPPDNGEGASNEDWPLTATNRAEIHDHTHLLPDGMEVWVTGEMDYSANPVVHYSFFASPAGGVSVKDCADAGGPATMERFKGGFTVSFAGSEATIAPNIAPDPANPGVLVANGNGATCGPILLGLDCSQVVQNVKYVGGVFYKTVCGTDVVVFSTSACPTPAGVSSADFFAYNA